MDSGGVLPCRFEVIIGDSTGATTRGLLPFAALSGTLSFVSFNQLRVLREVKLRHGGPFILLLLFFY